MEWGLDASASDTWLEIRHIYYNGCLIVQEEI